MAQCLAAKAGYGEASFSHFIQLQFRVALDGDAAGLLDVGTLLALDQLCARLVEHGLPAGTPAALVQAGTTPQQRVLTGTLQTLPAIVKASEVKAPTLVIIGEVVRLRDRLKWFEPTGLT